MECQADSLHIAELVVDTLLVLEGVPIDTTLLALSEVLARLLAADPGDPEEHLFIIALATRKWLASGKLPTHWERQATLVRVQ